MVAESACASSSWDEMSLSRLMPGPPAVPAGALQLKLPSSLLGLRGLNNLGQTCFMNCILQIFLHCPPVARFFLSDRHNRLVCIHRRRKDAATDLRPCLACEMDSIFAACFSGVQVPAPPAHPPAPPRWSRPTMRRRPGSSGVGRTSGLRLPPPTPNQTPYSPHTFLHAMWCSSEHFAGYEQQDAHEFLVAMLAGIYSSIRDPRAAAADAAALAAALKV